MADNESKIPEDKQPEDDTTNVFYVRGVSFGRRDEDGNITDIGMPEDSDVRKVILRLYDAAEKWYANLSDDLPSVSLTMRIAEVDLTDGNGDGEVRQHWWLEPPPNDSDPREN